MNSGGEKKLVLQIIFLAVGIIYLARLFYLQVIDDQYVRYAQNNVLQEQVIHPARGLIYDRNGELLVYNDAVYDLMVVTDRVKEIDTLDFCNILGITKEDFIAKFEKIRKSVGYSRFKPSVFEKQLTIPIYAKFQEKLFDYPGFYVEVRTDRKYKHKNAAHVMGYIGEVTDKMIEASGGYYRMGDYIGISGIERSYEEPLRGRRGIRYVLVDVHNRAQGRYKDGALDTASIAGKSLTITLDQKLQEYGEKLMMNKVGSVVAIEPATGEILALVSSPTYDPNLFIGRQRSKNFVMLQRDSTKPLFNRPLGAPYPPGSIFKVIESLVGQQEGVLARETRYHCGGGYRVGGHTVKCSHPHPSPLDLPNAIMHSCNPYFCYVFRSIVDQNRYGRFEDAYKNWYKHIQSFGLGKKLDIDLYGETKGLLPSSEYYDRIYGRYRWKGSTIISLSIGQGELGITPLQMANVVAIVANRGYYITPHIARYIGNTKTPLEKFTEKHKTTVDPKYFETVVEGMNMVVNHGTGYIAKMKGIEVCGKTGTVQNPHGKDHSVFFAFAPMDNPKIAIAVVVENSGFGSTWAAPIASLMMEQYLTDTIPGTEWKPTRTWLEERLLKADFIH